MSRTRKSLLFLAITFAISWGVAIGAHAAGLSDNPRLALGALTLMMTGPAIAAIICVLAFEKGRRVEALGLRFQPNIWWLWAWVVPLTLAAASVVFTLFFSGRTYIDVGEAMIAASAAEAPAQADQLRAVPSLGLIVIAASATLGALINAPILTFTEELGWRGYLYDLWRPAGFWRAALGTGLVWGLWHAPAIYFYGLNYPNERLLGIPLFTAFCMLLAVLITHVRERARSVWAAGLFHGAFNAVGGLTLLSLSDPDFPWNGIVGIGGFIALALGCAAVLLARRGKATANPG